MFRIFFFFLIFLLFSEAAFSLEANIKPDSIIITGKFIDGNSKEQIPYLPVRLYNRIDTSRVILSFLSLKNGSFKIKINSEIRSITLKSEISGYNDLVLNLQDYPIKNSLINLGLLELDKSFNLKEVSITADLGKPFIKIYKVKALETNEAPVIKSFINTLPEITLSKSEYLADGNKKVVFYLNGVKSDKNMILNLPIDLIDKVAIVSNPSLLRNNSHDEVVLNVITKSPDQAITGSSNSISGSAINTMLGTMIEPFYLKKDLLISLSANPYFSNTKSKYLSKWTAYNSRLDSLKESGSNKNKIKPIFLSGFFQKDLYKDLQLSLNLSYNRTKTDVLKNQSNQLFIEDKPLNSSTEFLKNSRLSKEYYAGAELAYKRDRTNIFVNLSYLKNDVNQQIYDHITANLPKTVFSEQINNSTDFASQVTVEETYTSTISQRFSLSYNLRNISSDLYNTDQEEVGAARQFKSKTNYKEENYSAFTSLSFNPKVISLDLSLKTDFSNSYSQGILYSKKVLLSPGLYLYKKYKKSGIFNLEAYRSIAVPNQLQVNNGYVPSSQFNYIYGNDRLVREITDKIDLSHNITLSKKYKLSLNSNVYFRRIKDLIDLNGYQYNDLSEIFSRGQANIGDLNTGGVYFAFTKKIAKLGYIKLNTSLSKIDYKLKDSVTLNQNTFKAGASSVINIFKILTSKVEFEYKNFSASPYSVTKMRPELSLGISGKLVKKKLYFDVDWTNALNLSNVQTTNYQSYSVNRFIYNNGQSQNVSFSITYLFGGQTDREKSSNRIIDKQEIKAERTSGN